MKLKISVPLRYLSHSYEFTVCSWWNQPVHATHICVLVRLYKFLLSNCYRNYILNKLYGRTYILHDILYTITRRTIKPNRNLTFCLTFPVSGMTFRQISLKLACTLEHRGWQFEWALKSITWTGLWKTDWNLGHKTLKSVKFSLILIQF